MRENEFVKANSPKAKEAAEIISGKCRFTVLTERLIRIEYSENTVFEDNATQIVMNRDFPLPEFSIEENETRLVIETRYMRLRYQKGRELTVSSLMAEFNKQYVPVSSEWYYGTAPSYNLKGTVRTLDKADGETELEDGLMSRREFTVLDDSKSLVIRENEELMERQQPETDIYLFGYAADYYGLLRDFYNLCGAVPLLPRYAFGNIWSRYHKYTQQEYIELMDRFINERCPFSAVTLDMDWHLVDYDERYGRGWTGYTWNKELFPDYKAFLKELKSRNLASALNLHPADGVVPYEEMYTQMADALGVKDNKTVKFDINDKTFREMYFKILHHPYEDDGVDFWWIDWQQGIYSDIENLDPLWALNYYHTIDMRKRNKREFILSRYAGPGSHRYPIGFSGDTVMSWESLKFQPYFTATSSNIGFTWWSHDVGGFMLGISDDELALRWLQLGVFSPITRLHNSHPLFGKEPWNYREDVCEAMKKLLRLRHKLIPYLYAMNYETCAHGIPLVQPVYYKNPNDNDAYDRRYRNEYYFGSELLIAPITAPADKITTMAHTDMYIPEGIWFDFFNGRRYIGKRKMRTYRKLSEMPVLVRAGGIIPMAGDEENNFTGNPQKLYIRVFAGNDNIFRLYEDDGITTDYKTGRYTITNIELKHGKLPELIIYQPDDIYGIIPKNRCYDVEFNGYTDCGSFEVLHNGKNKEFTVSYENGKTHISFEGGNGEFNIRYNESVEIKSNDINRESTELVKRMRGSNFVKQNIYNMIVSGDSAVNILLYINYEKIDGNVYDALSEIFTADTEF